MNQYRVFFLVSWIYIVLQTLLILSKAQGAVLYPPFEHTLNIISGTCYGLTWLFFLFVFHYFRQRGFVPWLIALYGLLSLVDPLIDILHPVGQASVIRLSDSYVWFHFTVSLYRFVVIAALFSVRSPAIAWRCRWIAIVFLLAIAGYWLLPFTLTATHQEKLSAYGPAVEVLPVVFAAGLLRKTRRHKRKAQQVNEEDTQSPLVYPPANGDQLL